jgi:hypothetical protein
MARGSLRTRHIVNKASQILRNRYYEIVDLRVLSVGLELAILPGMDTSHSPTKSRLLLFSIVLSLGALSGAGCYAGGFGYSHSATVSTAPPPPSNTYYEYRAGSTWVEGRWVHTHHGWQWRNGYWLPDRHGHVYIQGYWHHHHGRWTYTNGYWARNRAGYVYSRGYWGTRNGRRAWIKGSWQRSRPGQRHVPGRWVTRNGRRSWQPATWTSGRNTTIDHRRPRTRRPPAKRRPNHVTPVRRPAKPPKSRIDHRKGPKKHKRP